MSEPDLLAVEPDRAPRDGMGRRVRAKTRAQVSADREAKLALLHRLVAEGRVVVKWRCPVEGCGGPHPCSEHVGPGDPEARKLARRYARRAEVTCP